MDNEKILKFLEKIKDKTAGEMAVDREIMIRRSQQKYRQEIIERWERKVNEVQGILTKLKQDKSPNDINK